MSSYSSSSFDVTKDESGRDLDENNIRTLYETTPYPGPSQVKKNTLGPFLAPVVEELKSRSSCRVLDVGCGTGANLVPVGMEYPEWELNGLDLSGPSLALAKQHTELNGVSANLHRGSYLDPLPFEGQFDLMLATGTVHHCADPVKAMQNIRQHLRDDGYMLFHVYGEWRDKVRFGIKEILDFLEPDRMNHKDRFELFSALVESRDAERGLWWKIKNTTLSQLKANIQRKLSGKPAPCHWSIGYTATAQVSESRISGPDDSKWSPWVDAYCNPVERGYQVPDFKNLLDASGFKVHTMFRQGTLDTCNIPEAWGERYAKLDDWSKWRINELLTYPYGSSFIAILQKS